MSRRRADQREDAVRREKQVQSEAGAWTEDDGAGNMRILYEDRSLIAVYKEPGLAVQTKKVTEKDLESILLAYLAGEKGDGRRPELFVVHRIDQPVDGIVLFAKNKKAAADLTRQLTDGRMKKIYRAETAGTIPSDAGSLEDYLVKDGRNNRSFVTMDPKSNPAAKIAKLSYRKIGERTLEIELFTGRHHQIRVQLAHAGMPIVGDRKYGGPPADRLMLTAARLQFIHPDSRKKMEIAIDNSESVMDIITLL